MKTVSKKSSAELALMSHSTDWVTDNDLSNSHCTNILDKANVEGIIEWLEYVDAKRTINENTKCAQETYENMISITNSYKNGKNSH